MKKITAGIIIILIGLTLKAIFNHNIEYWFTIKNTCLVIFFVGLGIFQFPIWNKIYNNISVSKKENKKKWLVNRTLKIVLILFYVSSVVILEKVGKRLNFELRNSYLSENTIKTKGKIIDYKKLDLVRTGEEEFYLVRFEHNGRILTKGILNDYDLWENENSQIYSLKNCELKLNKVIGSTVEIEYSEKYPSFLRMTK
jgi:hypothetical protein